MAGVSGVPQVLPVLSRGKHRRPAKGACFMELAAFLAGERWSDHPACTHPLLAQLARLVNDNTSDANRSRLAPLVPSVIGLTTTDPQVDARIALRCACTALPVAAEERQRVLAVSVLSAERVLAGLEGRHPGLEPTSKAALDAVPLAAQWAYQLIGQVGISIDGYRRHAAPATVQCAALGIAHACIRDADDMLYGLLSRVVGDCAELCRGTDCDPADRHPADPAVWESLCQLTGAR